MLSQQAKNQPPKATLEFIKYHFKCSVAVFLICLSILMIVKFSMIFHSPVFNGISTMRDVLLHEHKFLLRLHLSFLILFLGNEIRISSLRLTIRGWLPSAYAFVYAQQQITIYCRRQCGRCQKCNRDENENEIYLSRQIEYYGIRHDQMLSGIIYRLRN